MAKFSKDKGKRGERQLASVLREYGYDCRRAQQYAGGTESADVIGLPGIHIECKCYAMITDGRIREFLYQAIRDCTDGMKYPVVFWKEDRCNWHVSMQMIDFIQLTNERQLPKIMPDELIPVTMTLDNWMTIYREYEAGIRIKELQGVNA